MALRKQEHIKQITERCLIAKKKLVSRNELREIQNIGARDVNVFIVNFLLQAQAPQAHNAIIYHLVREFNGEKS